MMTESPVAGPMSMIQIDGSKIKRLREEQGLTQLYLATAVQVTTDTISRWENRRYPSIKKENGLKLAEALNVSLDDLLEDGQDESIADVIVESAALSGAEAEKTKTHLKKIWPLLLLSGTLTTVFIAFIWYFVHPPGIAMNYSVERFAPPHCISGQPFPVVINVSGEPNSSTSLIIREKLAPETILSKTSPTVSTAGLKNKEIKWLKKVNETALFAYLMYVEGQEGDSVSFRGTASIGRESDSPSQIQGNTSTIIGQHHWADRDKNNAISDNEILLVFEKYSEIVGIDLNIDLIEEIWLGSGYRWNSLTTSFEIFE